MAQTQLASMFIGSPSSYEEHIRKKMGAIIHITDGQTDDVLGVITDRHIIDNTHRQSLEDTLETFDFRAIGGERYDEHLAKRNRVIIPAEDQGFIEFIIHEASKYRDTEGLKVEAYTMASYLDLKKASIIEPQSLDSYTPSMAVGFALNDTEWRPGTIEGTGTRTFHIEDHTNPYALLKRIAREFELELNFRVETDGNRVTGRYVDLLEQVGEWRGREIEFGRDLIGIRRTEKTDNIYTALLGLGPDREDGTRLEVFVEDEEALQRWGRPDPVTGELQHLVDVYEPRSERQEMTQEELEQYTRTELNKRINAVVEYETTIADLENVPGMENKKIRFGDTIRIKDTKFNPPLYLEARIFMQDRSITDQSEKDVKLGDYTEFTEEEVRAIWEELRDQINQKISAQEMYDYTYEKMVIDNKDDNVRTDAESYANTVSSDAKDEAITYTNNTVDPIIVSVGELETDVVELENDLGEVDTRLVDAETNITQAFNQIELKAEQTELDTVEQRVTGAEGEINVIAGEVELRATKTEVDAIEGRVTSAESSISVLSDEIELKVEEGDVRSIFTQEAGSFTFEADQINFDGHVFGEDATFAGVVEGGGLVSENITISDGIIAIDKSGGVSNNWLELSNGDLIAFVDGSVVGGGDYGGHLQWSPNWQTYGGFTGVDWNLYTNLGWISLETLRGNIELRAESYAPSITEEVGGQFAVYTTRGIFLKDHVEIDGTLYFPDASGTSPEAINIGNNHLISERNDGMTMYPNRAVGTPFVIRTHDDRASFRSDWWVHSSGRMVSPPTYESTTTSSANVYVNSAGSFRRESSSLKYKKDIEDLQFEVAEKVLDLRPVWFRSKYPDEDDCEEWSHVGLIAEEVAEVEPRLTHFKCTEVDSEGNVTYLDEPIPEGVKYSQIGVYLLPIVKDLLERVIKLEEDKYEH